MKFDRICKMLMLKAVADCITKYVSQQYVKLRHSKPFKRVTALDSTALAGGHISCFTACSRLLVLRLFVFGFGTLSLHTSVVVCESSESLQLYLFRINDTVA